MSNDALSGRERAEMSKPVELYKGNASGRCSVDVYFREDDGKVKFTDLRTLVDYSILNYTSETSTALERLACYKLSGDCFDLDCSKTSAKRYSFKPVQDMYEVLWPVDEYPRDIVDSAETLVSANAALWRCKTENQSYIKRRNPKGRLSTDWDSSRVEASEAEYDDELNDLNDFAHAVATIGNFMPVPCGHQFVLSGLSESYDQVLDGIQQYYSCSSHKDEELFPQLFTKKRKHQWPAFRGWLGYFDGWNEFVEKNYLKGSFVDDDYRIVPFNYTFSQLTEILENRSRVMLKEYGKRLGDSRRSTTV